MQAATITLGFNEMLKYEARGLINPRDILKGLDDSISRSTPMEMFITAGIGVLDLDHMSIDIASAANPRIYQYSGKEGKVRTLEINGLPLGLPWEVDAKEPFRETTVRLEDGDVLVFASDGVEEARNSEGLFYGGKCLSEIILDHAARGEGAGEIKQGIVNDVHRFMDDAPQTDHITVVMPKILQGGNHR